MINLEVFYNVSIIRYTLINYSKRIKTGLMRDPVWEVLLKNLSIFFQKM